MRRSGLPKRTFDRRFRAATGYSPLAYVQALRIEEAKQLLETGAAPVEAIAREVGYEDIASFRRLFPACRHDARRLPAQVPAAFIIETALSVRKGHRTQPRSKTAPRRDARSVQKGSRVLS